MSENYKGFDENFKCRGMQYEVGQTYETDDAVRCGNKGFHSCEFPFDVFRYYAPANSRYAKVVADGEIDRDDEDSKVASSKLHIATEIGLPELISAGVKFILDRVNWKDDKQSNTGNCSAATNTGDQSAATNTGYQSAATNTGYQSAATNTGDQSAATNTGYQSAATNTGNCSAATNTGNWSAATNTGNCSAATNTGYWSAATNTGNWSAATNTGYQSAATNTGNCSAATNTGNCSAASVEGAESVAMAIGYKSKAKGALGCWIVLSEWDADAKHIKTVKCGHIDGETLKPDVWYRLQEGEFVEVDHD